MEEKDIKAAEDAINSRSNYMGVLAHLQGIPVMKSPFVKEPTLLLPEDFNLPTHTPANPIKK